LQGYLSPSEVYELLSNLRRWSNDVRLHFGNVSHRDFPPRFPAAGGRACSKLDLGGLSVRKLRKRGIYGVRIQDIADERDSYILNTRYSNSYSYSYLFLYSIEIGRAFAMTFSQASKPIDGNREGRFPPHDKAVSSLEDSEAAEYTLAR